MYLHCTYIKFLPRGFQKWQKSPNVKESIKKAPDNFNGRLYTLNTKRLTPNALRYTL